MSMFTGYFIHTTAWHDWFTVNFICFYFLLTPAILSAFGLVLRLRSRLAPLVSSCVFGLVLRLRLVFGLRLCSWFAPSAWETVDG